MSENPELKHCPFCGSRATVKKADDAYFFIECNNTECHADLGFCGLDIMENTCGAYESEEEAIKKWNYRWQPEVHDIEEFYKD